MLISQILSRDSVTVSVDAVVYYRVSQYKHLNNNECILLIHRDFCFLRLNFGSTGIYVCLCQLYVLKTLRFVRAFRYTFPLALSPQTQEVDT